MPIEVEADRRCSTSTSCSSRARTRCVGEIWRLRDQVLAAFGTDEAIEAARRASGPVSLGEEAP